jgi:hypothetical protein
MASGLPDLIANSPGSARSDSCKDMQAVENLTMMSKIALALCALPAIGYKLANEFC